MPKNLYTMKIERAGEPWIKPVDSLVLLYQVLMAVLVLTGNLPPEDKLRLLGYHALIFLALMVVLWNLRNITQPLVRFACDFYPLVAMLFFYKEVGFLVHQYFDWTLDDWLLGVDNEMGKIGFRVWNFQKFYPPA